MCVLRVFIQSGFILRSINSEYSRTLCVSLSLNPTRSPRRPFNILPFPSLIPLISNGTSSLFGESTIFYRISSREWSLLKEISTFKGNIFPSKYEIKSVNSPDISCKGHDGPRVKENRVSFVIRFQCIKLHRIRLEDVIIKSLDTGLGVVSIVLKYYSS